MTIYQFTQSDFDCVLFHNQLHPRIKVEPVYFNTGFSPRSEIYGRAVVLKNLLNALSVLPETCGFIVWDVYRPRMLQAKLFDWMRDEIRKKNPQLNDSELYQETQQYVALPSAIGDEYCSPHLSGGAIDLTLFNMSTAQPLAMGTPFDDCSPRAHRDHFEHQEELSPEEQEIKKNRQLLRQAMEFAGFISYPYEWWHFDIGTILWSRTLKQPKIFGPLFEDKEWPTNPED